MTVVKCVFLLTSHAQMMLLLVCSVDGGMGGRGGLPAVMVGQIQPEGNITCSA